MKHESDQLPAIRHSLAHLLAAAVLELYPGTKTAIGPATDTGFYYDFDFAEPLSDKELPAIEAKMRELLPTWSTFDGKTVSADEARMLFADNPYKLELIDELEQKGEEITVYTSGSFTDLCKGGHVKNAQDIAADGFSLSHIAGAYWRGSEKNKMLTRVYGLAFNSKEELEAHVKAQEEAAARDHRVLGKELSLFVFSDVVGKGLPLWTEKGATIRRELERFIVDEEIRRGYRHVITPDIAKIDLYKKSGHYPYYKDSMYAPISIDEEEFMLRPMTCPHHFELYLSQPRSYRDLPLRIAELAKLYRYEQSGELTGLIRVRSFCLADAHIVCTNPEQAGDEVNGALDLIEYIAHTFGLEMGKNYWYRLSLGDRSNTEKYYKDDAAWDTAENILRAVLQKRGSHFVEAPAEAAFYGPKIDIQMKNIRGKDDTAFTVQYDFVMPKRFQLVYTDKDGTEKEAVVVHRSSIGAIERIIGFLIEHYGGNFPLWLSPTQVAVLPIAEAHHQYAQGVHEQLQAVGIRSFFDNSHETLGKKVRSAKKERIPYFIIIGDKDIAANAATLESRDHSQIGQHSVEEIVQRLQQEIKEKR
jgi:threonyl-tRNA synthetase